MNHKIKKSALAVSLIVSSYSIYAEQAEELDIERIEVSGSSYRMMESASTLSNHLSKDTIDKMPHIADDVFRLMPSIPGVSAGDYSANFFVRGGEADEVLVLLDGQQLYRPFHMKSFSGAFSIIDTENIGRMDFSSGGYSAKFGNKMSGVLDITSLTPSEETEYSLGASFINARAGAQGSFSDGKGSWLVSARRGYLDMVLKAMDDETSKFEPIYGDVYGKASYLLTDDHELSVSLLYAFDDEILDDNFKEWDGQKEYDVKEKIAGKYASQYLWMNLSSDWSDELSSTTILSIGKVDEDRHGGQYDPYEIWLTLDDEKEFSFVEAKQDWHWRISDEQVLQFGWQAKQLDAEYDYKMEVWYFENYAGEDYIWRQATVETEGSEYSLYINDKFKFSEKVVTEVGLRYDSQDYMGFDDNQTSPRASIAYLYSPETTFRLSWGHYYQAQDILGLQVADGVTEFEKAQKAEHRIIGMTTQLNDSTSLRVEGYQKLLTDIRPRYENVFDPFPFFPEGQVDRRLVTPSEADVIGLEVGINQQYSTRLSWSANYSWSEATDEIDGKDYPRSWDQTHALNLSVNYLFENDWNLHTAFVYHTGWPITGEFGTTEIKPNGSYELTRHIGERNQEQLDDYMRIDIRASKTYQLNASELTVFFEVTNLLNFENECCVEETEYTIDNNGGIKQKQKRGHWLPLIPSLGIKWLF